MDIDKTIFSDILNMFIGTSKRQTYTKKEELATVGLEYNNDNDITENDLRWEHGLRLRGAY